MKHYIQNRIYSTTNVNAHNIPDTLGFARSAGDIARSVNTIHEARQANIEKQKEQWKQNIPQGQTFSTDPEGSNLRRTYGTAVDNRQYSNTPVGDYGLMGVPQAPEGDYHNWQNTDIGRNIRGIR